MNDSRNLNPPAALAGIIADTEAIGFAMASEPMVGSLLRTLAATKPCAHFLELGTGTGLSTSWLLDGMSKDSTLLTVDNEQKLLDIARKHLGGDTRLSIICDDGDRFVQTLAERKERFDFIFADTWAGKYRYLEEALGLLNKGGIYLIDDMLPQPNWPDGHPPKVDDLLAHLEQRKDMVITKMAWSCGVVICVKV